MVLNQLRHIYEKESTHTCTNKKNQKFTATILSLYPSTPMGEVCITILFCSFFVFNYHQCIILGSDFFFSVLNRKIKNQRKTKWRRKKQRKKERKKKRKKQRNKKMTRNPRRNLSRQKSCKTQPLQCMDTLSTISGIY